MQNPTSPDLIVVGAGIVGLAHAAVARERGLDVTVVERDQRAVGASIRNFGHIGAAAQGGVGYDYACVARERWVELGERAGFDVAADGTVVVARTEAELAVLEEFAADRPAEKVELLTPRALAAHFPLLTEEVVGGALLPLDVRVSPPDAIAALAAHLAAQGVVFRYGEHVGAVERGTVHTSRGTLEAPYVVHAVGHDVDRLFPAIADEFDLQRCVLRMLDIAPPGDVRIAPAVLTGTGMLRYAGLAAQPSAARVEAELRAAFPEVLDVAMNLMLTQRPDGSLILGDTHHDARTPLPFEDEAVSDLILREGARLLGTAPTDLTVRRRWRGIYAHSRRTDFIVAAPHRDVRVVAVTSGIGMTTALGLAPTVLDGLL